MVGFGLGGMYGNKKVNQRRFTLYRESHDKMLERDASGFGSIIRGSGILRVGEDSFSGIGTSGNA